MNSRRLAVGVTCVSGAVLVVDAEGQQLVAGTWLAAGDYVVTLAHPHEQDVVRSFRVTRSGSEDPGLTLVDLSGGY